MKKCISFILLLSALLAFTSCKKEPCDNYKCFSGTIQCDKCMGKGFEICTSCKGSGKCSNCDGDGRYMDYDTCTNCNGRGFFVNPYNWEQYVQCSKCNGLGIKGTDRECYRCDESDRSCSRCKGSGLEENAKTCNKCNGDKRIDCPDCVNGYIK